MTINKISYNKFAIYFFSFLVFYKIIGVTIHKQYGFGFYYWVIHDGVLFIFSFLFILFNLERIKELFLPRFMLIYSFFSMIILFQIYYIINFNNVLRTKEDLYIYFVKDFMYIFIIISSIVLLKNLLQSINLKKLLYLYYITVIAFFIYDFHIQESIFLALTMGPNFSHLLKDVLPGYTWGFHLFFSPFFSVFSIFLITILKIKKRETAVLLISILSIYVLILVGGRGTLLSFSVILFIFIFSTKIKLIILSLILLLISSASFIIEFFSDNKRIYELLTFNINNDASGQGRMELFNENFKVIDNNLFLGLFQSYPQGEYIHNMLSLLQDYGLFIFIIFVIILIHAIKIFFFNSKIKDHLDFIIVRNIFLFTLLDHLLFKYSSSLEELYVLFTLYGYAIYRTYNIKGLT